MSCVSCESGFGNAEHLFNHFKNTHSSIDRIHHEVIKRELDSIHETKELTSIKNGSYFGPAIKGLKIFTGFKENNVITTKPTKSNEKHQVYFQQFTCKTFLNL